MIAAGSGTWRAGARLLLAALALAWFPACGSSGRTVNDPGDGAAAADHAAPVDTGADAGQPSGADAADARDAAGASDGADARDSAVAPDAVDARDAAGAGDAGAAGDGGLLLEAIHYYGRWQRQAARAVTVNTGSHVVARFSGTGIAARFDTATNATPSPTLVWRIDQADWQEAELAATMPLATGLAAGAHDVFLMVRGLNENQSRWTPPLVSSITFLGFDVTGGALEATPRPARPRMEVLGDSITEGINLWPSRTGKDTPCWRSDGRLAYSSQTAQLLGAEWRQVGFGRQGLLVGGNGGVPTANDAFNWFYAGVPRDDWQPDLVVINQGTNDSGASAASFAPAYATFLATVRAGYPNAKIAAMRPFAGTHAAEIRAQVDARRAAGDTRVYYVDTTGWLTAGTDFTDSLHPNATGSTKAAQALAAAIMQQIGLP